MVEGGEGRFYARVFGVVAGSLLALALFSILRPFLDSILWAGLLAFLLDRTMGMRVTEDDEVSGIDQVEHAETAYDFSGAGGGASSRSTAVPTPVAAASKKVDA